MLSAIYRNFPSSKEAGRRYEEFPERPFTSHLRQGLAMVVERPNHLLKVSDFPAKRVERFIVMRALIGRAVVGYRCSISKAVRLIRFVAVAFATRLKNLKAARLIIVFRLGRRGTPRWWQ